MKPSNIYEAMALAQSSVLALIEAGCDVMDVGVNVLVDGFKPRILVMRSEELDQLVMDNHAVVTESPVMSASKRVASIDMRGCRVSWVV